MAGLDRFGCDLLLLEAMLIVASIQATAKCS